MRNVKYLSLAFVALAVACTPSPQTSSEIAPEISGVVDQGGGVMKSSYDVNKYPVAKTVCDPFDDTPDPRSNQGLKAELYYLQKGTAAQHTVGGVISKGKKSDRNLFFSALNVPTRMFDQGFATDAGPMIKADDGSNLIENFALRFTSILRLAKDQKPGMYELAVLSDDGAILTLRESDGVYRPNVSNDGDHTTRLACGATPITLNADSEIPISLDYYQGPRYHISLVVLMREYKADRAGNKNGKDPACGLEGNSTWFNPDQGSKPQKAYTDLLARGWQPLSKDNYALANEIMFNPCKDGVAPLVSNFRVLERFNDGFSVTWTTDIPSTSAVVVTDPSGASVTTVSDNVLRTSHSIRTTGQKANTLYSVQAVSISDTYGRTITPGIMVLSDL